MPTIKLIGSVKAAFNSYLIRKVKFNGLSVNDYIEKEAARRSSHWRKEKDEFAHALQQMHNQNSANLNKVRELEAELSGIQTKKQIFDDYLKRELESCSVVIGPKYISKAESLKISYEDLGLVTPSSRGDS